MVIALETHIKYTIKGLASSFFIGVMHLKFCEVCAAFVLLCSTYFIEISHWDLHFWDGLNGDVTVSI